MDLKKLGNRLERLRIEAELSQRATAERAGISSTYLRGIENAENPKTGKPSVPAAETIVALAGVLGGDAAELLPLADYPVDFSTRRRGAGESSLVNRSPEELAKNIHESVKALYRATPFLLEVAREQLVEFAGKMKLLSIGTYRCTAEEEPKLSKRAAERCEESLEAVSFEDTGWWRSDEGSKYLDIHRALKKRGVDISRVFIAPEDEWESLLETFRAHVDMGIRTVVVDIDDVPAGLRRDFVIYDDSYVREGSSPTDDESTKTATFTDSEASLLQARVDLEELMSVGQTVDKVFIAQRERAQG